MTLGGKSEGITIEDLIRLGTQFGVKRDGRAIVEQIRQASTRWPDHAKAAGVPEDRIESILREIRARQQL